MYNIILMVNYYLQYKFCFLICLISISIIFSCSSPSNHITSQYISNSQDRINELGKYFNLRTPVLDAEFDIYDVSLNSRDTIPGPTDRDYKVAMLIKEENLEAWLTDVVITSFPLDYTWTNELVKDNENFETSAGPLMFASENKELILFENEGIIIIRIVQN